MRYRKIGSKFTRKYGKTVEDLAIELNVSVPTLIKWDQQGFDVFYKSKNLNSMRGNLRLRQCWDNIRYRCGNPKDRKYKYYGGRGIKVKMTKLELAQLWERDGAELMEQPSIDRINPEGHYEFSNCRFIEMIENRVRGNGHHDRYSRPQCKHCNSWRVYFRLTKQDFICRSCGSIWKKEEVKR